MFSILQILILSSVVNRSIANDPNPQPTPFQDWDYIVYSQRWPITSCTDWKERSPNNTCNLPQDNSIWTVHGIWPTKIGAKGPFFCNSALHFDLDQLQPMMPQLQEYWTNIEANTKATSFWKHEWNKHGTCASSLPELNSVTNFFSQGLQWNREYQLAEILAKSNVVPNVVGYNISTIFDSIRTATGKNPTIHCVVDSKNKNSLISEIRLCFNKSFELIDCNVGYDADLGDGDVLSDCSGKKNIMYLAKILNSTKGEFLNELYYEDEEEAIIRKSIENFNFQSKLLKLYSFIKFLMWITL